MSKAIFCCQAFLCEMIDNYHPVYICLFIMICLFFLKHENIYIIGHCFQGRQCHSSLIGQSKTHFERHLYKVLLLTSFRKLFKFSIPANGKKNKKTSNNNSMMERKLSEISHKVMGDLELMKRLKWNLIKVYLSTFPRLPLLCRSEKTNSRFADWLIEECWLNILIPQIMLWKQKCFCAST